MPRKRVAITAAAVALGVIARRRRLRKRADSVDDQQSWPEAPSQPQTAIVPAGTREEPSSSDATPTIQLILTPLEPRIESNEDRSAVTDDEETDELPNEPYLEAASKRQGTSRFRDPAGFIAIVAPIACGALVIRDPGGPWVRTAAGATLVILLPSLIGVLLIRRSLPDLGSFEVVVFGVAAGIALTTLTGVALARSSVGLERTQSAGVLAGALAIAAMVAWYLRRGSTTTEWLGGFAGWITLFASIIVVVVAMTAAVRSDHDRNRSTDNANLWMLQHNGRRLDIGISYASPQSPRSYELLLVSNGSVVRRWTLRLDPGESWKTRLIVPPGLEGQQLVATLSSVERPAFKRIVRGRAAN